MTHTLTPLFPYHPYPYTKKKITTFSNFQIQSLNTEHPHNSLTQWLHCTNGHRARAPANQHQMPNQFASNLRTPYLLFHPFKLQKLIYPFACQTNLPSPVLILPIGIIFILLTR